MCIRDRISTQKIENLILELRKNYTIIIVTHNMQQAARVSQKTAFLLMEEQGQEMCIRDRDKLGSFGDIVNVKDGYAKNYLIPNGFATIATPGNIKQSRCV